MGKDFAPCKIQGIWVLPISISDLVKEQLLSLLPECSPIFNALPYLMATNELHKEKYRWFTHAFQTMFSNIAIIFTLASNVILESIKIWAKSTEKGYKSFLQVDTSLYWIIDLVMDATLHLPSKIHDILVADITWCYESIPLNSPDNLLQVISFIINIAFKHVGTMYPGVAPQLWVWVDTKGFPAAAKWASSQPSATNWFPIVCLRLSQFHKWLISHCFVMLGNQVWRQCTGIPMGFSCSPVWCDMYLLSYEI
jgi:hypothetical protein